MIALETLTPGQRFRAPYFGAGTLLRVGPTFAIVQPDRDPEEVEINTPAGTVHERKCAMKSTHTPGLNSALVSPLEGQGLPPDMARLRVEWLHTEARLEALATLTPIRYPASLHGRVPQEIYADSIRACAMQNTSVHRGHEKRGGEVLGASLLAIRDWETAYRLAIFRLERATRGFTILDAIAAVRGAR